MKTQLHKVSEAKGVVTSQITQKATSEGLRIGLINLARIFAVTRKVIDSKNTVSKPYVAFCRDLSTKKPYESITMELKLVKHAKDEAGLERRSEFSLISPQLLTKLDDTKVAPSGGGIFSKSVNSNVGSADANNSKHEKITAKV